MEHSRGPSVARRILLAVVLLAAVIVVVRLAMLAREFDTALTASSFDAARDDPYRAARVLPAPHAEGRRPPHPSVRRRLCGTFHAWAAQQHLCADPANTLLSKPECDLPCYVPATDAMHNQKLYDQLVNVFDLLLRTDRRAERSRQILRGIR